MTPYECVSMDNDLYLNIGKYKLLQILIIFLVKYWL